MKTYNLAGIGVATACIAMIAGVFWQRLNPTAIVVLLGALAMAVCLCCPVSERGRFVKGIVIGIGALLVFGVVAGFIAVFLGAAVDSP